MNALRQKIEFDWLLLTLSGRQVSDHKLSTVGNPSTREMKEQVRHNLSLSSQKFFVYEICETSLIVGIYRETGI